MLSLSTLLRSAAPIAVALLHAAPAAAISGVCPDGSIFIVQRAVDIPCRGAKQVAPADIPPVKPEFLPRPYGWEVFNRETDPNNPYNLVDVGRAQALPDVPQAPTAPPPDVATAPPAPATPPQGAPLPTSALAPTARPALTASDALGLGLDARELEQLRAIVEVSQQRAPATFVQRGEDGPLGVTLRLAHSSAFAERVARALAGRGAPEGRIVVFHAQASEPGAFFGNLTFVQGHMAFHPDQSDATQFGVMQGALGPLAPGEAVLGYAVLPAELDLAQPIDVYWDDQLFTAQLRP